MELGAPDPRRTLASSTCADQYEHAASMCERSVAGSGRKVEGEGAQGARTTSAVPRSGDSYVVCVGGGVVL
jgi:hypothetical protein